MSLIAPVVDGQVVDASASGNATTVANDGTSLGKDAFMQLLVAQMKYQDPLEPTSNTEYISQLATFSQLEEMQNMTTGMDVQRASALVGETVFMKVTSETTGATDYIRGKVDYVQLENGKAYLSVNGGLYSIDDLDTVADSKYLDALDVRGKLEYLVSELPNIGAIDKSYKQELEEIEEIWNDMDDYQKMFLTEDMQDDIKEYMEKLEEIRVIDGTAGQERLLELVSKLPEIEDITSSDKDELEEVEKIWKDMTNLQKAGLTQDDRGKIEDYMDELETIRILDGTIDKVQLLDLVSKLPKLADITAADKEELEAVEKIWKGMDEEQIESVDKEDQDKVKAYLEELDKIRESEEETPPDETA